MVRIVSNHHCFMKRNLSLRSLGITTAALLSLATGSLAQSPALTPAAVRANALKTLAPLPEKMPGGELDTPALVDLGRKLYFEKGLSKNGSQSCNSCHAVDGGRPGVDNEPTSPGAFGKRGGRNSPTTLNAGFHLAQFWDGRAPSLKEQAKGPILNPVEMAMPAETEVIAHLKAEAEYPRLFAGAFPGEKEPLTYENLAKAIAAFERTLITRDRLDDFLKGQNSALTAAELKGLNTFLTTGCTACHNGPLLGGNSYQKLGLIKPYPDQSDVGREAVTKEADDRLKFKVPSLRNIAATQPYFHDGKTPNLSEAVRTMANLQLGLQLTPEQESDLVTFLRALTGKGIKAATAEIPGNTGNKL